MKTKKPKLKLTCACGKHLELPQVNQKKFNSFMKKLSEEKEK